MGSKRHLLVNGRGARLPLVVTGANRHDVTPLDAVLQAIMIKRRAPSGRRSMPQAHQGGPGKAAQPNREGASLGHWGLP